MVRFLSEADILDGAAIPYVVRPGSLQEQPGCMQGSAINNTSYSYSSGMIGIITTVFSACVFIERCTLAHLEYTASTTALGV